MKKFLVFIAFCSHYGISASAQQNTADTPAEATALLSAIQLTNISELELKREELKIRRQDQKNNVYFIKKMIELQTQMIELQTQMINQKTVELRSNPCYRVLRCYYCLCSPLNYCFGDTCDICQCSE